MDLDQRWTQRLRIMAHQKSWVGRLSLIGAIWMLPLLIIVGGWVHGFFWQAWSGYILLVILLWVLAVSLEFLIGRPRPFMVSDPLPLMRPAWNTPSFPSAHAAMAFGVIAHLWIVAPWVGVLLTPVALFVSLSRIFVGVHYVSDMIAGAVLGIAGGLILTMVFL